MDNLIGKEILNYRIVSLIGKGGMGSVYLAEHKFIDKQKAAVKVINANMANDFTRQMLKEEAEHLAGLHHHNIVTFHDYHIDEAGNIYLVMEYADGKSLEDFILNVNGLVVEDRICPLFEPILDAVGYAHKKGILHRDIKPANVVITTDGVPKILDFGIAKIIKNGGEEDGDNLIMGTPSYMSPEQVRGEHLDERSDIYSLGVLLHQMLTGNAPYDTTTLTEQDINKKVVEEPLPRLRTYYKYVSERVQKVVDKATAKNPKDRYQNCEEFKKALHRAVYPPKMPVYAKVAAVLAVILAVGIGTYIWDYNRVKTYYYKDYVEVWGVPQGVGELSESEHSKIKRSYKFVYQKRKLLRVSHVNSLDKLIEDGESERNERPIDQEFQYTEGGLVHRVTVKDYSGKTLYVKSYNDKLNTMAFQYDDEHGTERVISNSTVGYGRLLEANNDDRGHISRWWLEYDENGYVSTIRYAGLDNSPVGDANGIYGRKYVRDDKGRVTEIHYIGADGAPQSTKWGLGIKKFYYDDKDNWVRAEYLTTDGKPAYDDSDGVCVYLLEYDENGNLEYALFEGADGKLMYPQKYNIAGTHEVYDEHGFCVRTEFLGADRKVMYEKSQGIAIIENEYDENGYISKSTFYDPDGKPVESTAGNASFTQVNDDKGNVLEQWNYDRNGKRVANMEGIAGMKYEYDSVGNVVLQVLYGVDGKPCITSDGNAGNRIEYNDRNLITKVIRLGKDLKPAPDNNNVCVMQHEYDKRGNTTRTSFYKADGKTPCLSNEGIAGWENTYDERGNWTERRFFDTKGGLVMSPAVHYARVVYTYDDNGNLSSERYYNAQGSLTSVDDGKAGNDYVCDKRGNVLEERAIGTNGGPAPGWATLKKKYDKYNNVTEIAVFDGKGAAVNGQGVHRYEYAYNSRNQQTEERHYGTDGSPCLHKTELWASVKAEYDNRGNIVKRSYYGTDGKPCRIKEGWSSATYEYDAFGHPVKQCFFGTDGKPSNPKDMVPVGLAKYDKWGNLVYIAAQDGKGNYIVNPNEGYAICRSEFDNKANMLEQSYYDVNDKPMKGKDGYHKVKYKYDDAGNRTEEAYYGTDGKPMMVNGVHMEKYTYDEHGNNTVFALYGTNGKPKDCDAGWQKITVTYAEDGTPQTKKIYNAAGKVLATQTYNKATSEWGSLQIAGGGNSGGASSNWRENVRAFGEGCPMKIADDIYVTSVRTSSNAVTITIKLAAQSKYDMGDDVIQKLNEVRNSLRAEWRKTFSIPSDVALNIIFVDKADRTI